jgi:hypothetical protein
MMAKLKLIVAVLAFFGVLVLGTGLIAQQRAGGRVGQTTGAGSMAPTIKALIEARIAVAKEAYETTMAPPRDGPLDDMPLWSRRWMDEQILLDSSPIKRLAAIQDHLDRTKLLEAIAEQRVQSARGRVTDTLKVKYFRLEAEQMIAELRIINPALPLPKAAAKP